MKLTIKNISWSRRKMWLVGGTLLLVLIGAYITLSIFTWSNYKKTYTAWQSDVKGEFDVVMKLPTETSDQKNKWLSALDSTAKLTSQNRCNVNRLYSWQETIIPALKKDVESCQDLQTTMNTFSNSLTTVTKSVHAEIDIASILAEPLKNTSVNDTAYQAEVGVWTKAQVSLSSVDVPSEVASVKSAAISAAGAIKTAWNGLMVANTAQNASQYQAALNGLSQTYNGLSVVSSESSKALQKEAEMLQKSYDAVF